jgi:hypothetical protein
LEILIIRHLRRVLPRTGSLLFTRKKRASSLKQSDVSAVFKTSSKYICSSMVMVCADPIPPTPSASSATKTQKTHKKTLDNTETADEGNIPVEYFSLQPKYRSSNKKLCIRSSVIIGTI